MIARYNVEIAASRDGFFVARCVETGTEIRAHDPEHDICHALTIAGLSDGPVQFWRNGKRTLSHSSAHKMGARRIKLGETFPLERVKRHERPEIFTDSSQGLARTAETPSAEGEEPGRGARRLCVHVNAGAESDLNESCCSEKARPGAIRVATQP